MFDFQKRQNKLQAVLNEKSFITLQAENIFYLTGFQGSFGIYLQNQDQKILISDSRYKEIGKEKAQEAGINFQLYTKDFKKLFGELQKGDAFIEKSITLEQKEHLEKQFPNLTLLPTSSPILEIRQVKDSEEIEYIQYAQNHVDNILFSFLKEHLKEGITEQKITALLKQKLEQEGKYSMSFDPIIAFGENSASPHHSPGERKLIKNENILVDCGVKYKGYCSDMTRNAYFGKPSPNYLDKYNLLLKAQEKALEICTKDTAISLIDKTCRKALKEEDKYFTHSLGHGVGLEVHEAPGISGNTKEVLKENQVITIEPGLYYPNKFGIRIEDLLVITKKEPIILSLSSKELLIIESS